MPTNFQSPVLAPLPVAFARGEGAWLWDTEGKKYLDALAGVAVCGLGHAHPRITQAICDQAGKLLHTSNWYEIPLQAELAERVCKKAGMDNAFFCNSGAEANEAAIKLARLYGHQKKVLGLVQADDATKAKAARIAFLASRTNTMLSIPMVFFMVTGSAHGLPRIY